MRISKMFSKSIYEKMETAMDGGNSWVVYPSGSTITGQGDIKFCKSQKDAQDACVGKEGVLACRDVRPVYEVLKEQTGQDAGRDDIDYYFVNSRNEISATLQSNPDLNPLHNADGYDLFDELYEHKAGNELLALNNTTMNHENLEYLKSRLFFTGFGDGLDSKLENNIRSGASYFELPFNAEFQGGRMNYNLHFKRGDMNEMYFFNKYDAFLTKPDGRELLQTFYLEKGHGITMKEAYNLLDGRAVNKDFEKGEGQKYNAWVKLDFEKKTESGNYRVQSFHENYGYNLEKIIDSYPLAELKNESVRDALLHSLRKGNVQEVTWVSENGNETRFISADPENRGMRVYDRTLKEITTEIRNSQQLTKQRVGKAKGMGV